MRSEAPAALVILAVTGTSLAPAGYGLRTRSAHRNGDVLILAEGVLKLLLSHGVTGDG